MKKFINSSLFGILILTALFLNACSAGGGQTGSDGGDDGVESSDKELTSFSFTQAANSSVLTADAVGIISTRSGGVDCITITVPYGTDISALKATFTTTGESVSINETEQTSGETANNYGGSSTVTYTVTAEDGSTKDYILNLCVGNYIKQWGSSGTGNGQFSHPGEIKFDSSDNIYIADSSNNRIQKFDTNENYISQFGSFGAGNGQFDGPHYIAIDSSNNVYVNDISDSRIQKFSSTGNYITTFYSWGREFALDTSGNMYFSSPDLKIKKYDSNGNLLLQWGEFGSGDGQLKNIRGIGLDSSGYVYVVDIGNHRIQKYDSNGNYISQFGSRGSGNGQFEGPTYISFDSNDNIYVLDNDNFRIQKFNSNGIYISQFALNLSDSSQYYKMASNSNGYIYIVDSTNNTIHKIKM